jgi:hypothetical protein
LTTPTPPPLPKPRRNCVLAPPPLPAPDVPQIPRFSQTERIVLALVAMGFLGFVLNVLNSVTSGALTVPPSYNGLVQAAMVPATLLVEQLVGLIRKDNPDLPTQIANEQTSACAACRLAQQEYCRHA